jgi:AraC-like DNA-binding protein
MKRFRNCIIDKNIPFAIERAEDLLSINSNMIEEISKKTDFKYGAGDGSQVALNLVSKRDPINLFTYRPWRKSKAVGYYQNGNIYISLYALERFEIVSLVGLLLHEYAHHCGYNHNSAFGTSNFKTQHKVKHSVPYFLSENVEKWL